jgi:quercetin dioxygenase-like cupin family protein
MQGIKRRNDMFKHFLNSRELWLGIVLAGSVATASAALADECPTDKVLKTPQKIEKISDDSKLKGEVVNAVDPSGWRGVKGLMLRTRRLTIQPGGFVPTHSHADRPAIIYIVSGEIIEHSTICAVPIVHKAGDSTAEFGANLEHWWENKGPTPVVLTSSDLVPIEMMNDKMMQMP